jgi:hypothetical protein
MYSVIIPKKLDVTELKENDRSKGQKIAYLRYGDNESQLVFALPWIYINAHGIPSKADFYKNDSQRMFIKLPLDEKESKIKDLSDWLRSLDEYFGSDEMKEKLFGTKKDKYQYQPCYRLPQEDDEEDSKKKNPNKKDYGPKPPFIKLKIDTTYPDGRIATTVYKSVMENGKRVRTKIDNIETIDDLHDHISFLSKVLSYVTISKVWAHNLKSTTSPKYGVTFKMLKAEYEPRQRNSSNIQQFINSEIFVDDEEDMGLPPPPPQLTRQPTILNPTKTAEVDTDDSDEESDDESDNEQTMKVVPKKVIDSDSEEDHVPVTKQLASNDSESDEDSKKKPSKKTPVKSKTKSK